MLHVFLLKLCVVNYFQDGLKVCQENRMGMECAEEWSADIKRVLMLEKNQAATKLLEEV